MKSTVVVFAVLVGAAIAPAAADDGTQRYVVRSGDSCLSIAIRVVGDRAAVRDIHRLNTQLGPPPHALVPGSVLVLPVTPAAGPDARVTRTHGDVKIRKPTTDAWDAAATGVDLYRAYRVGAASHASAELTFADDALLGMRERTIVVIYGPEKRLAKVITAIAELERGTLETRLGELDGKPLVVRTGAGEADLRAGAVVITTSEAGPSAVSNHGGAPVELRGRTKVRTAVRVAAGMGARVVPGKPPEPPRPLPATPLWTSHGGPYIASNNGTIALTWGTADRAAVYRVAVRSPDGTLIVERSVPMPATSLDLSIAPGAYRLTVSAIDGDGLESIPSSVLAIERIAPVFNAPSGRASGGDAVTPRVVVVGTTIVAPSGSTCSTGGSETSRIALDQIGLIEVRCRGATGEQTDPFVLDVMALGSAPAPRHADGEAPAAIEPASVWRAELGAYGGFHTFALRRPIDLGQPVDTMHALESGPTLGLRGGWFSRQLGIEAETGFSSLGRVAADGGSKVFALALHAVLRRDDGRSKLGLLAGIGFTVLAGDLSENTGGFSWGAMASWAVHRVDLRFDLRHELAPGYGGGVGQALQATVGASFDLVP